MTLANGVLINNGCVQAFHASEGRVHAKHDKHEKEHDGKDTAEGEGRQNLWKDDKHQTNA